MTHQRDGADRRGTAPAPARLWDAALPRIRAEVGEQNFAAWIAPLTATAESGTLALAAPNATISGSVARHFVALITKVLTEIAGRPCPVRISVGSHSPAVEVSTSDRPARTRSVDATFDRFVVGESNREAYEQALAVVEGRFRGPSPLVIHGGVGLGKTHLARAIGNVIRERPGAGQVICEPSMDFVDRLLAVVGGDDQGGLVSFAEVAVLVLDDIHFLSRHAATQDALLELFSILHRQGTPVVLTSDRTPEQIPDLEQRLRRRFEGGLLVAIAAPDFDLRRRILARKAQDRGIELPTDVAAFLADRIVGNVRALEGALTRVSAYAAGQVASGAALRITRAAASAALRAFMRPPRHVDPERIAVLVAEARGITPRALASRGRTRDVTVARQLAMYLCRAHTPLPLVEIAARFGRKDHTTVLHACSVVERLRAVDPQIDALITSLEAQLHTRAR